MFCWMNERVVHIGSVFVHFLQLLNSILPPIVQFKLAGSVEMSRNEMKCLRDRYLSVYSLGDMCIRMICTMSLVHSMSPTHTTDVPAINVLEKVNVTNLSKEGNTFIGKRLYRLT